MALEQDASLFIKKFEGFTANAIWDVNAFRIGHGSDTIELADGTHRKVVQGDTTTMALADKDLARRIKDEFIPRVAKQVGDEGWKKLSDNAKIALISLAYNYGSITKKDILESAKSGNEIQLSKAIVDSTYNDNSSLPQGVRDALRSRRQQEAVLAKTDTGSSKTIVGFIVGVLFIGAIASMIIFRKKLLN